MARRSFRAKTAGLRAASEETLTRREAHRGCGVSPQTVPVASRRQESIQWPSERTSARADADAPLARMMDGDILGGDRITHTPYDQ